MVGEHLAGGSARVVGLEVERVRDPVEHQCVSPIISGPSFSWWWSWWWPGSSLRTTPCRPPSPGQGGSGAWRARCRKAGTATTPRARPARRSRSRRPAGSAAPLDVSEDRGGERAPAGGEHQLDAGGAVLDLRAVEQAHVDDRDALVAAARVVDVAQHVAHRRVDHIASLDQPTSSGNPLRFRMAKRWDGSTLLPTMGAAAGWRRPRSR